MQEIAPSDGVSASECSRNDQGAVVRESKAASLPPNGLSSRVHSACLSGHDPCAYLCDVLQRSGAKQFGEWVFEAVGGVQGLSDDEAKAAGPSFLFDDLLSRVKEGKVAFNFNLEMVQTSDKIDSATVPLPDGERQAATDPVFDAVVQAIESPNHQCVALLQQGFLVTRCRRCYRVDPKLAARSEKSH